MLSGNSFPMMRFTVFARNANMILGHDYLPRLSPFFMSSALPSAEMQVFKVLGILAVNTGNPVRFRRLGNVCHLKSGTNSMNGLKTELMMKVATIIFGVGIE